MRIDVHQSPEFSITPTLEFFVGDQHDADHVVAIFTIRTRHNNVCIVGRTGHPLQLVNQLGAAVGKLRHLIADGKAEALGLRKPGR